MSHAQSEPCNRHPGYAGRIRNRHYRACARAGFCARIAAELAGQGVPKVPPLYSHHATRQSHFERGWHSVTPQHIQRARQQPVCPQP